MPAPAPAPLPGVYFETVAPPLAEVLPRMDIAAFVGFAAQGPLDKPVPVEDLGRFRELFGPDLPLARDEERGDVQHAHLGPAVEAFFRQGGRRCWVVRVAGEPHRHRFEVPGLVRASDLQPAVAHARSAGSWADALRVGGVLEREPLRPRELAPPPAPGGAYRLAFDPAPAAVRPGELLEVDLEGPGLRLWLFAEELGIRDDGLTEAAGAEALWLDLSGGSPPAAPGAGTPVLLDEADALDRLAASSPGGPPLALRRLRFTLQAWTAGSPGEPIGSSAPAARLAGLAFHPDHPRYWGHLANDEELFRLPHGHREPPPHPETEALRAEIASPRRFPLAGPGAADAAYLPLGMPLEPDPETVSEPLDGLPGTALERDGLERFGFHLFLDPDLQGLSSGALRAEAEHKLYRLGRPLAGLHALLPVDEATLVAVPDAVHPGWTRGAAPPGDLLAAPVLALHRPDRRGLTRLTWSQVEGADEYILERSALPDFARRETVHRGPEREEVLRPEAACPERLYLRVRAHRLGELGPWSNTETAVLPETDFAGCGEEPLPALVLEREDASPGPLLTWRPAAAEAGSPDDDELGLPVELEEAADPAFALATAVFTGTGTSYDPGEPAAVHYYRVRARDGEALGPWSNTVVLPPRLRVAWTLLPPAEPALDLLAVQRALLRLCAARRDLVAVLALPRGVREDGAREHLRELRPGGAAGAPEVPPLTPGEREALAFGALYHPWVSALPAQRSRGQRIVRVLAAPPEGTVCGAIARRTLVDGAWVAPANQPFAGVLALEPALPDEAWSALTPEGVNLLVPAPRGFLVLAEQTLADADELRPLHVRRLLILLRRLALREGATYVFEPHGPDFRGLVRHRFERLLNKLFVRGAFAGRQASEAFRVVADDSLNPASAVAAGRFVVELRVAPSQPLAFLVLRLVQEGPEQLRLQEV